MGNYQPNESQDPMAKLPAKDEEGLYKGYLSDPSYLSHVREILGHREFLSMSEFIQHGKTNTMEHCLSVSYLSYKICKKLGMDHKSAARAGLLHDFYLYDWHTHFKKTGDRFHGLSHPKMAWKNAKKHFSLSSKERDIILKHMFPLTPIPPKSMEGFVVVMVDKYCGLLETFKRG